MLVKAVALFLVAMAVLAMFGRLRMPGSKHLTAIKCPSCGRFRVTKSRCSCGHGGKG